MEKIFIKNRKGRKLAVVVDEVQDAKGVAFVMHGLGGYKESPYIKLFADCFWEKGYMAVRFDAADTYGESEGNYADATMESYFEDLEDVILWSESQKWYKEPFCLAGTVWAVWQLSYIHLNIRKK